ncbi:MAG: type IX secretion system outer membrane channel protein PorV [Chitinophagaceae bacterium]|nr:type IX secretion system outer membrane channel protein PorV [Chitinophagaceae bacterium]
MKFHLIKAVLGLVVVGTCGLTAQGQVNSGGQGTGPEYTTITTAVPFMRISPDARSGAMGDVGIAISPDANAQFWNVSKLAMSEKDAGLSITYTPWLKDLVPDIFLAYISGYAKFGEKDNKNQAVSFSLRYFNLGDINYTDINAQPIGQGKPREFSFDLGYSRKLSDNLSVGLSGKFIHSNIINGAGNSGGVNYKPGNSFGVDFGAFYTKELGSNSESGQGSSINAGIAITNLGSKINYSSGRKDFIPTNLGIGLAYNYSIDEFNKLTIGIDFNKLLVPSPHWQYDDSTEKYTFVDIEEINNKSLMSGVFGSFSDATGGGSEELKEVMMGIGAEYSYQNQFFVRAGYFNESKMKGDRRFLSLGLGVKYSMFGLNVAYIVPSGSSANRNPLSNTLRFSLLFDMEDLNKLLLPNGKGSSKDSDKDERKEKK